MAPKCAVTVARRALPVVNGENLRHAACLWTDSSIISGVIGGRHCESPSAINCGIGREKGRGYGTERSLSESRCQKSTENVRVMRHRERKTLDVIILRATMLVDRVRKGKEFEVRLSKGAASSPIVVSVLPQRGRALSSVVGEN